MTARTEYQRGAIPSGLEVVPFDDPRANQSLLNSENYPIAVGLEGLEVVEKEESLSLLQPQRKPWWKRPLVLGVAGGVIVAIALGIGLGVGLGAKGSGDS